MQSGSKGWQPEVAEAEGRVWCPQPTGMWVSVHISYNAKAAL